MQLYCHFEMVVSIRDDASNDSEGESEDQVILFLPNLLRFYCAGVAMKFLLANTRLLCNVHRSPNVSVLELALSHPLLCLQGLPAYEVDAPFWPLVNKNYGA